jgi:signal transduction histidine kinase/DNA-binding response OmpR family regulator
MSTDFDQLDPAGQATEIARLVEAGAREGERDVFHGKRRWVRYHVGTRIEVACDGGGYARLSRAVMHNVSGGGLGFWTREPFAAGTPLRIREIAYEGENPWLPITVTHCTLGIRGYLIGAEFAQPIAESAPPEPEPQRVESAQPGAPAGPAPCTIQPRRSLRRTCACIAALGSAAGAAAAWLLQPLLVPALNHPGATTVAVVAAAVLGGVLTWVSQTSTARVLACLGKGVQETDESAVRLAEAQAAGFKELSPLIQAVLSLRARWRSREDGDRAQRQKLEELNLIKTNILNMVSHDLRTPLTSIRLYADMLSEGLEELALQDQQRFLKIITDECARLARLVDDLLEVQRLESGRIRWDMKPQDLSKFVRACAQVFEPMAASKSVQIQIECPDALPEVEADADKISQVLSNLVSNAIKYTPTGGQVHISARPSGNDVLISVCDTGPGIPRDKWDYIFERFARVTASFAREIGGVGLGLYIVRQIMDHHGGRVWLDSEVGKGSTFYIALPIRKDVDYVESAGPAPEAAGRILVCDADPELAARIAQLLRRERYEVRCVHSGCRLLSQIVEIRPDVVLTDLLLPDTDTLDLLASLTDLRSRQPFKLVAHTYVAERVTLRQRGVDVILARPAYPEDLIQAVRIANRHTTDPGKTVLLIGHPSFDDRRLAARLASAGHTPIRGNDPAHALRVADDYPLDVAIVAESQLADSREMLETLRSLQPQIQVLVVTGKLRRQDRQRYASLGVTPVELEEGREDEIVSRLGLPLQPAEGAPA